MTPRANRYTINKPLSYRIRAGRTYITGKGHTLNISSRGVLFATETELPVARTIDVTIDMGRAGGEGPEMRLEARGVTVRKQPGAIAVAFRRSKLVPVEAAA